MSPSKVTLQPEGRDLEGHRGRTSVRRSAGSERFRNGLLDLALRIDAHHLQELADAQVQDLVVHWVLLGSLGQGRRVRQLPGATADCRAGAPLRRVFREPRKLPN
jgi:hypothetical protein